MSPVPRYAAAARWLHWLTAALVAVIIPVGIWIRYFVNHRAPYALLVLIPIIGFFRRRGLLSRMT